LIIKVWVKYFNWLKKDLQKAPGKICFMGDIWSDQCLRPWFAITAHWITRNKCTGALKLKCALIVFH
ncbi:hypothetical protein BDN71DRAFT_1376071, partial [Pleurotus eryngii]